MRRRLALLIVLAGSALLWLALPPGQRPLPAHAPGSVDPSIVLGAYHIHSQASDGSGDLQTIARNAAAAGLRFAIVTDHGTAARPDAPPTYLDGVLILQGTEISTNGGHYVALGMPTSPFPLAGEAEDVVDDVERFGGFGIAAHPDSPKASLAWSAWRAPIGGLELLSLDSAWRDESAPSLARGLATYWIRPAASLATTLDKPQNLWRQWDELGRHRRIVGLPAVDAHAKLALGNGLDPLSADALSVSFPSYAASFGTLAMGVQLERPWSGDAVTDASDLLTAIRRGRVFAVVTALAPIRRVRFTAQQGGQVLTMGDEVHVENGPVRLRADIDAPEDAILRLMRDGEPVAEASRTIQAQARGPGVYRVEVDLPNAPGTPAIPWLSTNPIYVREGPAPDGPAHVARSAEELETVGLGTPQIEQDGGSQARVTPISDNRYELQFELAREGRVAPWVAMVWTLPPGAEHMAAVRVSMQSDGPMRASVQLREAIPGDIRWRRSIYVSDATVATDVAFSDLKPIRREVAPSPRVVAGMALLVVVDTVNNLPGDRGTLTMSIDGFYRAQAR